MNVLSNTYTLLGVLTVLGAALGFYAGKNWPQLRLSNKRLIGLAILAVILQLVTNLVVSDRASASTCDEIRPQSRLSVSGYIYATVLYVEQCGTQDQVLFMESATNSPSAYTLKGVEVWHYVDPGDIPVRLSGVDYVKTARSHRVDIWKSMRDRTPDLNGPRLTGFVRFILQIAGTNHTVKLYF